jgi:glutathione S-transferase
MSVQVLESRLVEQKEANRTAEGTTASTAGRSGETGHGDGPLVVGDNVTIADIACFSWINWAEWAGVELDELP